MKHILLIWLGLLIQNDILAQIGAWQADENGLTHLMIVSPGHFSEAEYSLAEKKFVGTRGGSWKQDNKDWSVVHEFHTMDTSQIGQKRTMVFSMTENQFVLDSRIYSRIDNGSPGALAGAWLITGRMTENGMQSIIPGDRKTMKILSGTRFQWIAYNSRTREFLGTGGGTYTTKDGVYVESIEFFSRDHTRVGAQLQFQFSLPEGNWRHTGKSSKGDPIDEVWTKREKLKL